MRLAEALREAWRDVVSGAGRSATFALCFSVVVGGIVLAAAAASFAAVRDAREFVASGAAVYVMKAEGRIDGRSCDSMSSLANVGASGALREEDDGVAFARLPQTPVSLFAVSSGFAALQPSTGDARGSGLNLSVAAARTLGIEAGERVETTQGATKVTAVFDYPDDGRDPLLAFAATGPVADDGIAFDQCWAMIWPHDEKAVGALGRTVMAGAHEKEERPVLTQLNQTRGSRFVTANAFDRGVAGPLVVIAGGVLGVACVVRRRLLIASDRHVGVGRLAQVVSQTAQVLLWVIVGSAATVTAVLVVVRLADEDRLPILQQSVVLVAAGGGAAVASCALVVCLIRDAAVYRYFKQR